jgi:hypothetical protein
LRRWHPGPGVVLLGEGATSYLKYPGYHQEEGGVALDLNTIPPKRQAFLGWLVAFLENVQARPAYHGCHGLHEWAMVYRLQPEAVRHGRWPLRYGPADLARIVEESGLRCTHFDAFRFFTEPARPLNRLQPTRDSVPQNEQRGCLHANMDLYKWAFKLAPYSPSELVADAFELAREIRAADMRASPYDLRSLGFEPIAIETAEGRLEYERFQRDFAARAEPIRERMLSVCRQLLAWQ